MTRLEQPSWTVPPPHVDEHRRSSIVGIAIAIAGFNFFAPVVLNGRDPYVPIFVAFFIGCLTAEYCSIAIWAALGPHRLLPRMIVSLAALFVALATLFLGAAVWSGMLTRGSMGNDFYEALQLLLFAPAVLLTSCTPLFIARLFTGGMRRARQGSTGDTIGSPKRQFGMGQLMAMTSVVAACLAAARAGFMFDQYGNSGWLPLLVTGVTAMVVTSAGIPCVWMVMIRSLGRSVVQLTAYWFALNGSILLLLAVIVGRLPSDPEALFFFLTYTTTGLGALIALLQLFVLGGYEFPRSRQAVTEQDADQGERGPAISDPPESEMEDV